MLVFKFGGASVKSADAVRNIVNIISDYNEQLVIVVSAMGKMTNAFEKLAQSFFSNNDDIDNIIKKIENFHYTISNELFENKNVLIFDEIELIFSNIRKYIKKEPSLNYNFEYDQIVSFAEIVSTKIIGAYINSIGKKTKWIDIRKSLKTNSIYREAKVDWNLSEKLIKNTFDFSDTNIYLTQGFIAANINNISTTLGREGSDYSAAILSYILSAEKLIIWKDVDGVFNADPQNFENPVLFNLITYHEAIELAFFGAKIIHPKTIKPLQNKETPLYIKSFKNPKKKGTKIYSFSKLKKGISPNVPIYIVKNKQILISISAKDFSFVDEKNLIKIFAFLSKFRIKINLMQNSAINFSICVDNDNSKIPLFIDKANKEFKVRYNDNLQLITIRHYNKKAIKKMIENKQIFIQQKSRSTVRFVVRN